jgi:carbamoyl-phosphate synthase large subunit
MEAGKGYLLPPANNPDYIKALLELCSKEKIQAIFCGSEPELKVLNENRDIFVEGNIFLPMNSNKVIQICMNKSKTFKFLEENNFCVPQWKVLQFPSNLKYLEKFPLPAVIKPSIGGGGSANVFLAQNREEIKWFASYLLRFVPEVIVQEYIGTPDQEYTVGILSDLDGRLINSIAVKRYILSSLSNRIKIPNFTSRKELGSVLAISSGISQGEIGRIPEVIDPCEKIALALKSCGPLNIQCRMAEGKVYVFEINPRFSGTTSLRAMVGFNEPDILIRRHLLGENIIPHFKYKEGIILRGLSEAMINRKKQCKKVKMIYGKY